MKVFSKFLNFFIFLLRVGQEHIGTIVFFCFLSFVAFPHLVGLKRSYDGASNFLKFFAIFLEFSITGRVGTHRNEFFYFFIFSLSRPLPTYFGLKRSYDGVF